MKYLYEVNSDVIIEAFLSLKKKKDKTFLFLSTVRQCPIKNTATLQQGKPESLTEAPLASLSHK